MNESDSKKLLKEYEDKFNFTCESSSIKKESFSRVISQIASNRRYSLITTYSLDSVSNDFIFNQFHKFSLSESNKNNFSNVFDNLHRPRNGLKNFISNVAINIHKYFSAHQDSIDLFCFNCFPLYFYYFSTSEQIHYAFEFLYDVINVSVFNVDIERRLFGNMFSSYIFSFPYLTSTFASSFFNHYQIEKDFFSSCEFAFSAIKVYITKDLQKLLQLVIRKGQYNLFLESIICNVFLKILEQQYIYSFNFYINIDEDINVFITKKNAYIDQLADNQQIIIDLLKSLTNIEQADETLLPSIDHFTEFTIDITMSYQELHLLYDLFYEYNDKTDAIKINSLIQDKQKCFTIPVVFHKEKQNTDHINYLFEEKSLNSSFHIKDNQMHPDEKQMLKTELFLQKIRSCSARPLSDFFYNQNILDASYKTLNIIHEIKKRKIEPNIIQNSLDKMKQHITEINQNIAISYVYNRLKNISETIAEETMVHKIIIGLKITDIVEIPNKEWKELIQIFKATITSQIYSFTFLNLVDIIDTKPYYLTFIVGNNLFDSILSYTKTIDHSSENCIFLSQFETNGTITDCINMINKTECTIKYPIANQRILFSKFSLVYMTLYKVITKIKTMVEMQFTDTDHKSLEPKIKCYLFYIYLQTKASILIDFYIKYSKLIQNADFRSAFAIIHPDFFEVFHLFIDMFDKDVISILPTNLSSLIETYINDFTF